VSKGFDPDSPDWQLWLFGFVVVVLLLLAMWGAM
jgi:hypothetical protein